MWVDEYCDGAELPEGWQTASEDEESEWIFENCNDEGIDQYLDSLYDEEYDEDDWEENDDEDWEKEWDNWEEEAEEKEKCKDKEWKAYCTDFDENASNDCKIYYSYNGCGKEHECWLI